MVVYVAISIYDAYGDYSVEPVKVFINKEAAENYIEGKGTGDTWYDIREVEFVEEAK